jgi:hypothetical protein
MTTARSQAVSEAATPLFDTVKAFLGAHGFDGTFSGDDTVVHLDGNGANGSWLLWITTDEPTERCVVYSTAKFMVPQDRRVPVLELISRINIGLAVGNFELDVDSGQVSFRTSVDVEGDRLTPALLSQLVAANVEAFDAYLPALESVVLHDASALAALDALTA